jgi:hypothetical protein
MSLFYSSSTSIRWTDRRTEIESTYADWLVALRRVHDVFRHTSDAIRIVCAWMSTMSSIE